MLAWASPQKCVSDRVRTILEQAAPGQLQFLPVRVLQPRGVATPEPFWIANWLVEIDCINKKLVKHPPSDDPDMGVHFYGALSIDPRAVPEGLHAFSARYQPSKMIVSTHLKNVLTQSKVRGLYYEPIRSLRPSGASPHPKPLARLLRSLGPVPPFKQACTESPTAQASLIDATPLQRIVRTLIAENGARSGKACSTAQIQKAEDRLGVRLPTSYCTFARTWGSLVFEGIEICGPAAATKYTLSMRGWKELDWPNQMVCISDDGRGGWICLKCGTPKGEESPVVYFDHELAEEDPKTGRLKPRFERAAKNFVAWLTKVHRGEFP